MNKQFNNPYEKLYYDLQTTGSGKMQCFGDSMHPVLKDGVINTYVNQQEYNVGDIVFCIAENYWIDAHFVIEKDKEKGYLIADINGWENGWTKQIFGKVIKAVNPDGEIKNF